MRHYMKERGRVMGRVGYTRENPEVLGDPRVMRGIKTTVPSSVVSRNYKYRINNYPSQGPEAIAGPSHQQMIRQLNPPTVESRRGARFQYDKSRETRTTRIKEHSTAEGRPVRSRQTTTVRTSGAA
ncbi:uncharacterized protein TNCV_2954201 [Trichonephila clavipes]|nr:uncharacterized protein TNCV_2954201 [Trichonephila clavipes]